MVKINEQFIVNEKGKAIGVMMSLKNYRQMLDDLEELAAIRAYDHAKAVKDVKIPFEQALREIKKSRR